MKQRFFRIALLALTVATTACSKSELDNIPTPTPIAGERISVTATIAGSEQTRVSLEADTDANSNPIVKVDWKASGETFAVVNGEATTTFEQTSGNNFEGTLPTGAASYIGIYPASAANENKGINIDLAEQTGTLDESKTYMVSASMTEGGLFSFTHVTALLRPTFKVGDDELSNALISKVVVRNTTTARSINLFGGTAPADTTGDITVTRTPSADDIYIYLCKGYTAGEAINVLVYTTEAGVAKLYNGTITVPEGKSLALGNLYTPTIALTAVVAEPNTILYFANEKASLMLDSTIDFSGFGIENTNYIHTFANGIGRISTIGGSAWTTLPKQAFYSCDEIQKVILPTTITEVGNRAFYGCANLEEVIMPGVKTIADVSSNYGVFELSNKLKRVEAPMVEKIGSLAFYGCVALEEVVLPTTGEGYTVGDSAFEGCSNLATINLLKATSIGSRAFFKCTSLAAADLANATIIDLHAFYGCSSLTSVAMSKVTSIGLSAFSNCPELASVTLPTTGSGYTVGNSAFWGSKISTINLSMMTSADMSAFRKCTSLQTVTLPTQHNYTLGMCAFEGCTALQIINLQKATSLGDNCFEGCIKLQTIDLKRAITLGDYCFQGCTALTTVTLGESIATLGDKAFYQCSNLKSVTINATTPPTVEGTDKNYCFGKCSAALKIYVPSDALDAYRTAWDGYLSSSSSVKWGNGDVNDVILGNPGLGAMLPM